MTAAVPGPDITSREHKRDPFSFYARLRAAAAAVRVTVPRLGDAWFLTRREDVVACLMDDRHFVRNLHSVVADAAHNPLLGMPHPDIGPSMLDLDGAAHRRLRAAMAAWFTRKAMERWRPQAESIAAALLDRVAERGEIDLVADYAKPFPLAVIGVLLGVTFESGLPDSWAKDLFDARRVQPRDDLASALACGGDGQEPLGEREFVAMVRLLLYAGHETTANLIASGVLAMLENGVATASLVGDDDLLALAIEELLRFCAPVEMATARFVTADVAIGDAHLHRGDYVFPIVASANRDEALFAEPDRLDLQRDPNPHVAFGAGPHHCIGLHLARMEAEIALRALFRRFPRLSLIKPAQELAWRSIHAVRGLEALPLRLR
jgi:cytochrome P450